MPLTLSDRVRARVREWRARHEPLVGSDLLVRMEATWLVEVDPPKTPPTTEQRNEAARPRGAWGPA
jgi:hypothetical protein